MNKSDRQLGMDRDITRRDFLNESSLAALGLGVLGSGVGRSARAGSCRNYPPTRTGLRGSHPGSFEVAHALARKGVRWDSPRDTGEHYDLVVVGGGLSGLAAAWFYRKRYGPESRILIVENHDDFGGHAKRNEFHQGGEMRLSWGGVFNLEFHEFSETVRQFIAELGIDLEKMQGQMDFNYGADGRLGPAIWFDKETYGSNRLVTGCSLRSANLEALASNVHRFPLSEDSRASLKQFAEAQTDITVGMSEQERDHLFHGISYLDFLTEYGGLTEEAAQLFVKTTDGFWGVSAHSLSLSESILSGLPARHILGGDETSQEDYDVAMFPDGNASVARMLVRDLIPGVATGKSMDDIVTSRFDYSRLDTDGSKVRLRLNATAVNVVEKGETVSISYVSGGEAASVKAKHCILACYHAIIPHLCPQLPDAQKKAQSQALRRPLILTNVLLRSSQAHDKLGISGAYCPGRLHGATWLCKGIHSADYRHEWEDDGPVAMMFWGMPGHNDASMDLRSQHRASLARLMTTSFRDIEREVRVVCDGMLGPGGFDVKKDILAITVNRWPHGYAYDYLDLWDPDWPDGEAPHEIARKQFGNISIANSDAGADAYTHEAIDQAWRAVKELAA